MQLEREQIFGYLGSLILLIGVFTPLIHLPIVGSITYVANGKGDGWFVFIFAVFAGALTFCRMYKWLLAPLVLTIGTCAFTFFKLRSLISDFHDSTTRELSGNPFAAIAQAMAASVQFEWGWGLLVLGIVCLSVAAVSPWFGDSGSLEDGVSDTLFAPPIALVVGVLFAVAVLGGAYVYLRQDKLSPQFPTQASTSSTPEPDKQSPEQLRLNAAVKVEVVEKKYLPVNLDRGRYQARSEFELRVTNQTPNNIAGVKGVLSFNDMFGSPVKSVSLSLDESVGAGRTRMVSGYGIDVNQFIDADNKLATTDLAKLKASFVPEMIVFADGTRLSATKDSRR